MGEQDANGWRVSRHRLVADATVGVIANPMSGRDIRRLVASASVFPNAEKASMVVRLTAAAGALSVGRVLVSTDTFGVSASARPSSPSASYLASQLWRVCLLTFHSPATSVTVRPSATTADTALYRCSTTLISLIRGSVKNHPK